jgi:hypothetical protein
MAETVKEAGETDSFTNNLNFAPVPIGPAVVAISGKNNDRFVM